MAKKLDVREYQCKLIKVVDGDTIDAYISLGFNIETKKRIRYMGIDTWESRTRDLDEKKKGLLAKARNKELLEAGTFKLKSFGTGKYGRVLGEIFVSPEVVGEHITECIKNPDSKIDLSEDGWVSINDILIEEGHAYGYEGGKKKDFKKEIKEEKEKSFGEKK
ncbi:MAG: thermonuclease family protein [Pelagibacteraceae bacterium]|nr:thermonuclease family protein [Pelagibacteraceae bacterium]